MAAFKKADEKFSQEMKERLKEDFMREFLLKHTVYVIEAEGLFYTKETVDRLKKELAEKGFAVRVYRRLI